MLYDRFLIFFSLQNHKIKKKKEIIDKHAYGRQKESMSAWVVRREEFLRKYPGIYAWDKSS